MFLIKKIIKIIAIWVFIFLIAGALHSIFKGEFPIVRGILLFPFTFTGLYFTVLIVLQRKYDFKDDE